MDNQDSDDYIARLAAQLKPLPAAARDEYLRELRQHIEQLIASRADQPDGVQSALLQMGDPKRVGRRLAGEWRFQNTKNIQRGWQYFLISRLVVSLLTSAFYQWQGQYMHANPTAIPNFTFEGIVRDALTAVMSSICIGWFVPGCAFRLSLYGWLGLSGFEYAVQLASFWHDISSFDSWHFYQRQGPFTIDTPLVGPLTMLASFALQCSIAYLVSAYRRGGLYPLRRADFRMPGMSLFRRPISK